MPTVRTEVSGKRGIAALKFRKIMPDQSFTHFEDRPTYHDVEVLANRYLDEFTTRKIDRVDVVYTKFLSSSKQEPVIETLLPLSSVEGLGDKSARFAHRIAVRVPALGREHSAGSGTRPASG